MQQENFDVNDPKNLGRPLYFNLSQFIKAIEMLICSDELEMALEMTRMVPSWYRENYPKELIEIRNILYRQMYDGYQYASEVAVEREDWTKEDAVAKFKSGYFYPRADILANSIRNMNNQGMIPWVCELSPSHGAQAIGLLDAGLKFNYFAKNMNHHATLKLRDWLPFGTWGEFPFPNQKTIFVFYESLEHAYRQSDLEQSYYKLGVDFDEIYLSVPYGTLGGGLPNWSTRMLGHVRTYSKKEFIDLADKFFPNRKWELTVSHSLVLVGKK